MTTPLREALVCLTNVEPKLCHGMAELQVCLVPAVRTSLKSVVDSLRATPTSNRVPHSPSLAFRSNSQGSSTTYNTTESSPSPEIKYLGRNESPGDGQTSRYQSRRGRRQTPPTVVIEDKEDTPPKIASRCPIFSHNILNDITSPEPPSIILPTRQANNFLDSMSDLPDVDGDEPHTSQNNIRSTSISDLNRHEGVNTYVPPPAGNNEDITPDSSPLPLPAPTEDEAPNPKRRSKKTGLWPPSDMPMKTMTQWHLAHTSQTGKKEVWDSFFAPAYKWDRTAMFRYIRWINKVSKDRWADWYEQCERDQVEATFDAARKTFASELESAR
ncbi:uncharacterized protein MELLADRAFT_72562 [Melampsora larici-populina 98AG31]|uniref:Uncharacterized protein n=1 Tax=Melampsora larici-populina (strain 98AG31 / pathotype 3-4-7) TaxID=747676 RepID=F4RW09_MELLP|nr:uncharacterized protein MELLADRAFT_72562 [Melampsora larici-populina 98AG31]EGG03452.1 hypothetical protein MELLADRAFT_72562 [Melampsora larici-populina 98AG31]